jgi:hypothetical protein
MLGSAKIAIDETVVPVLDPGRGRTKKGYFWAIVRDDRPWAGPDPPAVAYSYAPGRGAVHALKLLDRYRGVMQCDGYAAYKTIADAACGEAITLAFCWAHLRRKFCDIAKDGNAPIASEALERIAKLYLIEKTIRGQSADGRRTVRQQRSKPLVLSFLSVKGRVARALLSLAEAFGKDVGSERILIRQKVSQSDLAAMAGIARENVSRVLKDWSEHGMVSRLAGYYCLEKKDSVQREAEP